MMARASTMEPWSFLRLLSSLMQMIITVVAGNGLRYSLGMVQPSMTKITTLTGTVASSLGLAACPDRDHRCVGQSFDAGINYFFFYGPGDEPFNRGLRPLIKNHRDQVILAT